MEEDSSECRARSGGTAECVGITAEEGTSSAPSNGEPRSDRQAAEAAACVAAAADAGEAAVAAAHTEEAAAAQTTAPEASDAAAAPGATTSASEGAPTFAETPAAVAAGLAAGAAARTEVSSPAEAESAGEEREAVSKEDAGRSSTPEAAKLESSSGKAAAAAREEALAVDEAPAAAAARGVAADEAGATKTTEAAAGKRQAAADGVVFSAAGTEGEAAAERETVFAGEATAAEGPPAAAEAEARIPEAAAAGAAAAEQRTAPQRDAPASVGEADRETAAAPDEEAAAGTEGAEGAALLGPGEQRAAAAAAGEVASGSTVGWGLPIEEYLAAQQTGGESATAGTRHTFAAGEASADAGGQAAAARGVSEQLECLAPPLIVVRQDAPDSEGRRAAAAEKAASGALEGHAAAAGGRGGLGDADTGHAATGETAGACFGAEVNALPAAPSGGTEAAYATTSEAAAAAFDAAAAVSLDTTAAASLDTVAAASLEAAAASAASLDTAAVAAASLHTATAAASLDTAAAASLGATAAAPAAAVSRDAAGGTSLDATAAGQLHAVAAASLGAAAAAASLDAAVGTSLDATAAGQLDAVAAASLGAVAAAASLGAAAVTASLGQASAATSLDVPAAASPDAVAAGSLDVPAAVSLDVSGTASFDGAATASLGEAAASAPLDATAAALLGEAAAASLGEAAAASLGEAAAASLGEAAASSLGEAAAASLGEATAVSLGEAAAASLGEAAAASLGEAAAASLGEAAAASLGEAAAASLDEAAPTSLGEAAAASLDAAAASLDAPTAAPFDAAAAAPSLRGAAISLASTAGVALGLDINETGAALDGGGAPTEALFEGGDAAVAASSLQAAAVPVPFAGELQGGGGTGEGAAVGHWAAESLVTSGDVPLTWKATAAAYELDPARVAGEGAVGGASSSFLAVSQQLPLADSSSYGSSLGTQIFDSSYSSSCGGMVGSYSSSADGNSSAEFTDSYGGVGSSSSGMGFDSGYNSSDSAAACGDSCIGFASNYLCHSNSADGGLGADGSSSSGSVGFVNNYGSNSSETSSSSADGSGTCGLSQQYYHEGGTQQLCVYDNFSGSSSGVGDAYSSSPDDGGGIGYEGSSVVEYTSSMPCSDSSLVYDSSSGGLEGVGEGELASGSCSISTEDAAYCNMLPYPGTSSSSADYEDGVVFDEDDSGCAAAAAGVEEEIDIEAADNYGDIIDADVGLEEEENAEFGEEEGEEQEEEEGDLYEGEEEDQAEKQQPWRGVLGIDDLLTERDDEILQLLAEEEPIIPDELCKYFLHRVGCATADRTVTRLISIAAQLQVERVIDDAKVFAFCMQQAAAAASASTVEDLQQVQQADGAAEPAFEGDELLSDEKTPDDVEELDIGSLCAALQKNDDSFCGLSLDCFLDAAPVFLHAAGGSSAAVLPEGTAATAALPVPLTAYPARVAAPGLPVSEPKSELIPEMNTLQEQADYPAGAVPYPAYSVQPSFPDMQPSSAAAPPCDVADSNAPLLLSASHSASLYAAPEEGYDLRYTAAASVQPASYAAVAPDALAFPTTDGVGEASTVLVDDRRLFSAAAPVTVNTMYSPMCTMLPDAAAVTTGGTGIPCSMGVEACSGLPVHTSGVTAGDAAADIVLDATTGMANDPAAAMVIPSDVNAAATPFVGVTDTLGGLASGPSAESATGVPFDSPLSTVGIPNAFRGVDPVSSAVATDISVAGVDLQVGASAAEEGGAGLLAAVDVDASGVARGIPAGDISTTGGVPLGSAVDESILPAAAPLFPSILDAAAQPSPATTASVLPPSAADGATITPPAGSSETSTYTPFEAAAPAGSVDAGSAPTDSLLLPTRFSGAAVDTSYDAAPLDSVTVQTAATISVEGTADLADQMPAAFRVESDINLEPSVVCGTSRAASLEMADSTLQSTPPAAGEAPAAVNTVSTVPQSSKISADADVVEEK